ncbi:pilus assembly protein [Novosphingobium sp. KCTC 2891]|uniref:TadE/TadG family type IV pilus assembly protein n=1 Tax=Novosphingobium sp. KCTC 2891 TaxID=2989730 RepID=UPI0022239529|nr:TadE family protein [Novosphingobium sp. KCTC 2891]MCW1383489.1 pilus assembly protein [Novosphingobium sp. KCTC 2891]
MSAFPRLAALARSRDGATVVEFALILPVLMTALMGVFDISYNMWATTMLQGSLQQAARASTLESASGLTGTIDGKITTRVHELVPKATVTFSRRAYANFTNVGTAEDYTDTNNNGACDANEPFEDANANGAWDADRGVNGVGGARDAVLYKVTMSYPRAFPLANLIGLSKTVSVTASTVLRNQPFKLQEASAKVGYCK